MSPGTNIRRCLTSGGTGWAARYTLALVGLALVCSSGVAETVRVTSWNLLRVRDDVLLNEAAETLKVLKPDVVLLQGVRDWQMCSVLSVALKPETYYVVICSAFPGGGAPAEIGQVAVLCREKAYFSWCEPWAATNSAGGFAFAAVQLKGQRLGFVTGVVGENLWPDGAVGQLEQQKIAVMRWEVNRVQTFLVGLSCARGSGAGQANLDRILNRLQQSGYADALAALAPAQRMAVGGNAGQRALTSDFLVNEPSVFPLPKAPRFPVADRYPVTCDFELDSVKVAAGWTARAHDLELRSAAARQGQPGWEAWWWLGGVAAASAGLAVWVIARSIRRRPSQAMLPDRTRPELTMASSYTLVLPSPADSGKPGNGDNSPEQRLFGAEIPTLQTHSTVLEDRALAAEREAAEAKLALKQNVAKRLSDWLKTKFVQKLVADRANLLQTQQSAALKAKQVDERLARIEQQIQEQPGNYERRIAELTLELAAAREENRELIRARIAQVKQEMETVRARLRAEANENRA